MAESNNESIHSRGRYRLAGGTRPTRRHPSRCGRVGPTLCTVILDRCELNEARKLLDIRVQVLGTRARAPAARLQIRPFQLDVQ